ncbi:hypothetical protein AVL50_30600 [Flammeovirga sp. SJP92]|nr:hypothetical protein AVL50_30600 [Flammeovirga sp. SJP92]
MNLERVAIPVFMFDLFWFTELLVVLTLIFFNRKINYSTLNLKYALLLIVLLFSVILPYLACRIQTEFYINFLDFGRDGNNFLWITFKFPMYWLMGIIEFYLILITKKMKM